MASNVILTKTNAYIVDSVLNSAAGVDLDATNTSTINAVVATASAALAIGGTAGVGVSIGVALAVNLIGFEVDLDFVLGPNDHTTSDDPDEVEIGRARGARGALCFDGARSDR